MPSITGTSYITLTADHAQVVADMPDAADGFRAVLVIDQAAAVNYEGGAEALIDALDGDLSDLRVSAADDSATYPWGLHEFSQTPGSRLLIISFRVPTGDPLSASEDSTYRLWCGGTGGTTQDEEAVVPTGDGWTSYWPIDDVTDLADWATNAHDLTNHGAVDGIGKVGGAAELVSGESDWLEIPASTDYDYTTNFTFACWLKYNTSAFPIIWRRRYNSQYPIDIKFGGSNNRIEFGILAGAWHNITTGALTDPNGWHHICCTYDSSLGSQNMKIIVDGVVAAAGDDTDPITVANLKGGLGSNPYPTGSMDDVQLHGVTRSVDWVETYYNMTADNGAFWTVGALVTPEVEPAPQATPGEARLTVALAEVAEYAGEGLLTTLASYEGEVFVGQEPGGPGLLALEDGQFTEVPLPLASEDEEAWAAVQALMVHDDLLWAWGWEVVPGEGYWVPGMPAYRGPDGPYTYWVGDPPTVTPTVWCYGGASWSRWAEAPARGMGWRWTEPVEVEGTLYAGLCYVAGAAADIGPYGPYSEGWSGETAGGGTGYTYRLEGGALVEVDALPMRAGVAVGEELIRLLLAGEGGHTLEGAPGLLPYVAYTDPDWGDCWHPLQPMADWQARAWVTTYGGDGWQRLWSGRGAANRGGPSWDTEALGLYEVLTVWRNRLLMFGMVDDTPVCALWEPPHLRLGTALGLDWRVRFARAFGAELWALGTQGSVSGGDLRQAVLRARGGLLIESLSLEWGDGLGANQPTVSGARLEWARSYPTRVEVAGLTLEWSDGTGGEEARPAVGSLRLQWGDNHALNQPTLTRAAVEWHKGEDHRPAVTGLELQYGDGLGANQPTLASARLEWRSPTGGLKRPRVRSLTVEHGDGSAAHQPTVASAAVQWGDGLGANQPTVVSGEVQWSIGYRRARPALSSLAAEWGDHGPWPPPQAVSVQSLRLEWNDDASPVAAGQEVCWLTTTVDAPLLGLRVTAPLSLPVGRMVLCLVRCDREDLDVDNWFSYQRFLLNQTVAVEEPGTEVRIGLVKPAAVEPFDIHVQMLLDE